MSAIRKFSADILFDDVEDEVFFTRAALKADPDAVDFLSMTEDWIPMVDAARAKYREARVAAIDATALRVVANHRLDRACTTFGDDLFLAVDKNRDSSRWRQFFSMAVSRFIKIRFDKQVATVKAWLAPSVQDPILDRHRKELTTWTETGARALTQTTGAAMVRGSARIAREQLAEDLTRERDGLFEVLAARGRDRALSRDWPKQFFRVSTRKSGANSDDTKSDSEPAGSEA
jgi:hypothetical protein